MMDVCVKQEVKEEMMDTGMNLECLVRCTCFFLHLSGVILHLFLKEMV